MNTTVNNSSHHILGLVLAQTVPHYPSSSFIQSNYSEIETAPSTTIQSSLASSQDNSEALIPSWLEQDEEFLSSLSLFFTLVMVFMCMAGIVMNTFSLVIFTRPAFRRRSINVLLAGLSASDLCLCLLAMPVFSLNQLQKILPDLPYRITSRILVYAYPITLMAQTMSVWMLVSITIDRYLAVCHPFAVRVYCTTTRALLTILTIVLFSIGYNFVRFWEYTINDEPGVPDEARIVGLLRDNHYYMLLYQNIALLLTQFILPLLVLGLLNLQVAKAILEADETRRVLVASERREHVTAKMMLFVVIVFIFCYVLSFCLNLLEIFNPDLFKNPIGFLLNDVNNVLIVLNSSSSFIFYAKYSSRYRAQLRSMRYSWLRFIWCLFFCCCCIDDAANYDENGQRRRGYGPPQIKSYSEISATFALTDNEFTSNMPNANSKKVSLASAFQTIHSNGTSRKASTNTPNGAIINGVNSYGGAALAAAKQILQYNQSVQNGHSNNGVNQSQYPLIHNGHNQRCKSLFAECDRSRIRKVLANSQPHHQNWA
ncbi:serpentine type 7TM GPCR chemoreceptor srw domain-containing protein [Ditylenchus destructor]|uniref:Serpentine type 7TM GPCR chemoreceptor srw domain-containing protein n=1 Tax=Ditylenchus destructor TaxID=166010 RepID=A0AAD4MN67_9BILA|nr:serpentine type 7TM GPCR chemoreceptor srw domain-containing protein [Ditylenchus destructor]